MWGSSFSSRAESEGVGLREGEGEGGGVRRLRTEGKLVGAANGRWQVHDFEPK